MKIFELFNSPPKYEVTKASNNKFVAQAMIGGRLIRFVAEGEDDSWEVSFAEVDSEGKPTYGSTGAGTEVQVLSFVVAAAKEFNERYTPEKFSFSADDAKRASMYRAIIKRVGGFEEEDRSDDNDEWIHFERKRK